MLDVLVGALYLFKEREPPTTRELDAQIMVLPTDQFSDNVARITGGAVFSNDPTALQRCCRCSLKREVAYEPMNEYRLAVQRFNNLSLLVAIGDSTVQCNETWFGNVALKEGGGGNAATAATLIRVCKTSSRDCVNGNIPLELTNHTSGDALEEFTVEFLDAFNSPAFGHPSTQVRVTAEAQNVALSGQLIADINANTTLSEVRLLGRVNMTHNLTLAFTPDISRNASVEVHIRNCLPGEVLDDGGEICIQCGENLYSFDPFQACAACPPNTKCKLSTVIPEDSFWHSTSKSVQVHRCIIGESCEYEGREIDLETQAREAHAESRILEYLNNTSYQQCRQVGFMGIHL